MKELNWNFGGGRAVKTPCFLFFSKIFVLQGFFFSLIDKTLLQAVKELLLF